MTPRLPTPRHELLNEREAATYLGMSAAFLRADRYRGHVGGRTPGPAYLRLGRSIRYRRDDLDIWLAARRVDRGAQGNDEHGIRLSQFLRAFIVLVTTIAKEGASPALGILVEIIKLEARKRLGLP